MHLHWLMFALASVGLVSGGNNCNDTDYAAAYDALFEHLGLDNNDIQRNQRRPLLTLGITIVFVDLYVSSIIDVNEKAQSFTTQIRMNTAWMDTDMEWNGEDFCGVYTFAVPKATVWTPDIAIEESIKTDFGTKESPYLQLFSFSFIVSSDVISLTTACKLDLYRFPFDIQICSISLQSSAYSNSQIILFPITDAELMTLESKEIFQAQGEWELIGINTSYSYRYSLWDAKDQLIYKITIRRRPLLYVINIILPVFFFLMLDVTSFFLDASGVDKLSFKVTLLLSISVLLLILNDTLPSTADKLPLIGIYCSVIFSLIGISILETILVNFLMTKGAESRPVETRAVTGRGDGVSGLQIPPDSVRHQCWTRIARIIDITFLILYIITIIVFLTILGKVWFP